ncbi:hypothetical protein PMAYCL1PPCAC_31691, partial [Pristionchus mayeri]
SSSSSSHGSSSSISSRAMVALHAITLALLRLRRLFLGESLLDVASVAVDLVALEDDALVDDVVVIEGDEGESTVLVPHLVLDDIDLLDVAELAEVVLEHVIGVLLADAGDVQSEGGDVACAFVVGIAGHGSLRVDSLAIDNVRAVLLALVHLHLGGVGDESESSRPLRRRVAHDDNIGELAVLSVEFTHHLFGRVRREASDEELSVVLGLSVSIVVFLSLNHRDNYSLL